MPIKWLRLAHMVKPQPRRFGRNTFKPLKAIRPHQRVEAGQSAARNGRNGQPCLPTVQFKHGEAQHHRAADRRIA
jgi:hypothetical protein